MSIARSYSYKLIIILSKTVAHINHIISHSIKVQNNNNKKTVVIYKNRHIHISPFVAISQTKNKFFKKIIKSECKFNVSQ